jgi:hypothetical protein
MSAVDGNRAPDCNSKIRSVVEFMSSVHCGGKKMFYQIVPVCRAKTLRFIFYPADGKIR